ncbi:glycosyltransferase family 9 protein [Thalassobaculum sp. OXR-137]|uniref:glycosyltransferase family 9 protein n=1 Tax=Thalassobaculum sp. OXR-137 TaxID=3100173 RepID=UPI002AC96285|nr:glycosyltransferase family 9 protein [Thalassobaculum sp. OXR-137]WPZ33849.1 glycosyltransferase family 9 protein [Thalassobaculum sp. OXR-137]
MRTLFITSNRLGDAILSTAVLARLFDEHPQARVTVACGPVAAALFEGVPQVERVISWRKEKGGRHWWTLWRQVAGTWWDRVIDMRGSALAWTLLARRRAIYRTQRGDAHRLTQMAEALGLATPLMPRLWLTEADRTAASQILGTDERPLLAVAPTANWPPKAWPADSFAELIGRLTGEGGPLEGARVLVAGGPGERDLAAPVLASVPADRLLDLVDRAPLMTLAACFACCRLVVANDSGLMHLSAAAGAPTLGLFGPSKDAHYAPAGPVTAWVRAPESAEALLARSAEVGRTPGALMTGLSVEAVEAAARDLLDTS